MPKKFYDVFIFHVYEDENEFASGLVLALKKRGMKIWYSTLDLTRKTSVSSAVKRALKESKYGLFIISPVYLTRSWTMKELEAVFSEEKNQSRIVAVIHKITMNTFRKQFPFFASPYALSSRTGIEQVASRVEQIITDKKNKPKVSTKVNSDTKQSRKITRNPKAFFSDPGFIVLGGKLNDSSDKPKKTGSKTPKK